jgi:hypothetical protein
MKTLKDYAVNGAEKYWPITYPPRWDNDPGTTHNHKMWTLTLHETTCRFAKHLPDGRPDQTYMGQDGLRRLVEGGLKAPTTQYVGTVWQGCKVCGTASLTQDEAKALGQQALNDEKAVNARRQAVMDAKWAMEDAQNARARAARDARTAWFAKHQEEVEAVERAATMTWEQQNPEQAALLNKEASA